MDPTPPSHNGHEQGDSPREPQDDLVRSSPAQGAVRALTQGLKALAHNEPLAPYRRFRRAADPITRTDISRLGTDYGGWAVPSELVDPSWVCYCGGVGLDISFDLALIEQYGCTVHAFDPTPSSSEYVKRLAPDHSRFRFFPWGLGSADEVVRFYAPDYSDTNYSAANLHNTDEFFEAKCRSIPSIMRELGHDHVDFLKLDIEGAEYAVLQSVLTDAVEPQVLCVEFHTRGKGMRQVLDAVRQLRRRGYVAAWVDCWEATFVLEHGRDTGYSRRSETTGA
jgi:FkbM family methyltransferase